MDDDDPMVERVRCVAKTALSETWPHFTLNPVEIKAEPSTEPAPCNAELPAKVSNAQQHNRGELSAEQLKSTVEMSETADEALHKRTVAVLELRKQKLMEQMEMDSTRSSPSQCSSPYAGPELVVTTSSRYPSPSAPISRDDYVQLASEIEEFRRQNAALVRELANRDLFNNSLRYRLTSFLPMDGKGGVKFNMFTHDEGVVCMEQVMEKIHDARQLYGSEERFRNRPTFLGWSQYAERQGEVVAFAVKKSLWNVSPQRLMDKTWELQTDSHKLTRLGPSHLKTHITVLQKISDNVLVINSRTEDLSRTSASGRHLVLRTVYILFRVTDDTDGTQTLGIKTLDIPDVDRVLLDDEVWWDIFYWVRVSTANVKAEPDKLDVTTITELGGANTCAHEDLVSSRLAELVFLAIRWETHAVAPFLLQE